MVHEFGRLKEGEKREFDFEFTNTGKEDLIIEDCKGSCGCTVPEWPKEAIKPGQSAAIKVKFDSTKKEKDQEKSVTITANTEPEITTVIKIKAYVEASAGK
jgi:tRNA A37 threonylcarbamoyladenosine biosynthesis protein TsaE